MLLSRSLLLALCLVALGLAALPARAADTLRVMTFNVRLPLESDGPERWEARRDLFVKTIREQHPDVFGTQELYKQQGDYVVAKLPDYAWFGMGRKGDDGDEHMGVFYRRDVLRVLDSGNFWLSDTPDVPGSISWGDLYPRMVTWARFQRIGDGRTFVLFNTHLPYREQDDVAREKCATLILKRIGKLPADEPFVLTGDFNTTPASRVHAMLTQHFADAWLTASRRSGPAKTFHAFTGKPDRRIDWILVRGLHVVDAGTVTNHVGTLYPSDHFPVVADLAWPDRARQCLHDSHAVREARAHNRASIPRAFAWAPPTNACSSTSKSSSPTAAASRGRAFASTSTAMTSTIRRSPTSSCATCAC